MDKIRIRGTYVGIEMSFFKANNIITELGEHWGLVESFTLQSRELNYTHCFMETSPYYQN
jgi:hypothetical protein